MLDQGDRQKPSAAQYFLGYTCKEVDAAPISRPKDWATSEVMVPRAANNTKRTASDGCDVIQYTMLQYATGNMICKDRACVPGGSACLPYPQTPQIPPNPASLLSRRRVETGPTQLCGLWRLSAPSCKSLVARIPERGHQPWSLPGSRPLGCTSSSGALGGRHSSPGELQQEGGRDWLGTARDSDPHMDDLGLSPGGSDLCHSVGPPTPQYLDFKKKDET